jgi:glycerophosphoryl diester phosphodiesterase
MTKPKWRRSQPLLVAHRGDSARAPENTLIACERAITLGAEMLELDVQRTADGELVLMHDLTLDRTTDGSGLLALRTLAELCELDAGAWFGPAYRGTRIPRLADALDLVAAHDRLLCLEIKAPTEPAAAETADLVAHCLRRRGMLEQAVLASFYQAALVHARRSVAGLFIAPELLPEQGPLDAAEAVQQARMLRAPIVQRSFDRLDRAMVEALHEVGVAVWAWTANTATELRAVVRTGADGVMSDEVAIMVAELSTRDGGRAVSPA